MYIQYTSAKFRHDSGHGSRLASPCFVVPLGDQVIFSGRSFHEYLGRLETLMNPYIPGDSVKCTALAQGQQKPTSNHPADA